MSRELLLQQHSCADDNSASADRAYDPLQKSLTRMFLSITGPLHAYRLRGPRPWGRFTNADASTWRWNPEREPHYFHDAGEPLL